MRIKIGLLIAFILCSSLILSSDLGLEWSNIYCNTDFDCEGKEICISKYTENNIFGLSSKSDYNVLKANDLGREGMCAKVYTDFGEMRHYYNKYTGTITIPEVEEEETECPICENETVKVIEYVNQTVTEEVEVIKTNWTIIYALIGLFIVLMIVEFIYIRNRMNNNFNKRYGKKIEEHEKLKRAFPDFVKNGLNSKEDIKIKELSVEEMDRRIKESERKKQTSSP